MVDTKRKTRASTSSAPPSKKLKKDPAVITAETKVKQLKQDTNEAAKALEKRKREAEKAKKANVDAQNKQKQEATLVRKSQSDAAKQKRQAAVAARKAVKATESAAKAEKKQWKQDWNDYWQQKDVSGETLDAEPENSINQTDAGTIYGLTPKELSYLRHFPDYNRLYKNTRKLFNEEEVKPLAFRKYAMCAGLEDRDESILLGRGQELWEEEGQLEAVEK